MGETVKLTKRTVDAAAPGEKRRTVWDADLSGFGLRVETSGRKSYLLRYRLRGGRGGVQKELVIGRHGVLTVDQARQRARELLAQVVQGEDPLADRREARAAPMMEALFERYLLEHADKAKKASSAAGDRHLIDRHLRPALGKRRVADVTFADVNGLHLKMRDTPTNANRVLALASKMMNLAERWGMRPDGSNPCRHVQRYPEQKRERYLSAAELERLGDVLRTAETEGAVTVPAAPPDRPEAALVTIYPPMVALVRLLLFTGARVGELLALRWEWIDFEAGRANLPDSKTGAKALYLPPPAIKVLAAIPRVEGNPHVIVGTKPGAGFVGVQKPWDAIRAAAGLADVRLHDLRHSFASVAVAGGMSLPMIGKLLGHRNTATTARYAHLADDPVRAAAEGVGARISAALAPEREATVHRIGGGR
jgi:integrase